MVGVLFVYLACVTASGPTLVPSPELNAAPMSMCIASSFDNPLWDDDDGDNLFYFNTPRGSIVNIAIVGNNGANSHTNISNLSLC